MDLAITSTRCGLRRRSWAAGSTMRGRPRGEGLGIPSPPSWVPFADSPQLQFINIVVDIPFVPQTQILMVQTIQQTTEFPQLQYFCA